MATQNSINDNLKKFRLDNRFSQAEMAELLNVSSSHYSKIENGKCFLNLHHIEVLASNLGKNFNEMYNSIREVKNEEQSEPFESKAIDPTIEDIPNLKVPFEVALDRLKCFCIENDYMITIQQNGNIVLEHNPSL